MRGEERRRVGGERRRGEESDGCWLLGIMTTKLYVLFHAIYVLQEVHPSLSSPPSPPSSFALLLHSPVPFPSLFIQYVMLAVR